MFFKRVGRFWEGDRWWGKKRLLKIKAFHRNMPDWIEVPSVKCFSTSEWNFPQKSKKYSCLHAELALSCPRLCITAGLFNLLESPCLFCYFPRKIGILLFHPEIAALHRVAISPASLQLANHQRNYLLLVSVQPFSFHTFWLLSLIAIPCLLYSLAEPYEYPEPHFSLMPVL